MAKMIPVCDGVMTLNVNVVECTGTLELLDYQDYLSVGGPLTVAENIEVAWLVVVALLGAYCIKILKRGIL